MRVEEFIVKPRRMRLVERVTQFRILDTRLGVVSLLPGDYILEDSDNNEQVPVKARDLVRGYLPINVEANAEVRRAANTVGFQADLQALEQDMTAVMGNVALPLIEQQNHPGPRPELLTLTASSGQCVNEMRATGAQLIPRSCPTCGVFGKCVKGLADPVKAQHAAYQLDPREVQRIAAAQRIAQEQAQADAGCGRGGVALAKHEEDGQPTLRLIDEALALEPTHFIMGDDEDGPQTLVQDIEAIVDNRIQQHEERRLALDLERFAGEGGKDAA